MDNQEIKEDGPVDVSELNADIGSLKTFETDVSSATGSLRAAIKAKLDNRGYNKKAFGMLRTIDKMSDTQLADFRRTFDRGYSEVVGSRDGQPDMVDAMEEPAAEPAEGNVQPVDFAATT